MGCVIGGQTVIPPVIPPLGPIYAPMGCSALWYARNAIFARNGHCFKTNRGRAQFGAGCFPPYGKLGSTDQREVNQILRWEGRKGCR
ncbi:MAG: YARHG domain-containing protein [Hyphomicrobiales bacterium]|nr:YARHG domain-containing protein [Hyphomicrobiales bacterium]